MSSDASDQIFLRINILSENSVQALIEYEPKEPCNEPVEEQERMLDDIEAAIAGISSRAGTLWSSALNWVLSSQQSLIQGTSYEQRALQLKAASAATAQELRQATAAKVTELTEASAVTVLELSQATAARVVELKEVSANTALELKQKATKKVAATKAHVAIKTSHVARGLADVTNQLAARTQRLADGETVQKTAEFLGQARSISTSVVGTMKEAKMVQSVSSSASVVANAVSGFASAIVVEGREFASIQRF